MKMLLYLVIMALVFVLPNQGTDVGKLIPVEVVALSESGGTVVVQTDTGDAGVGKTLREAIANLKDAASGIIYLDTAEYLLLEPGMENVDHLSEFLKGSVKVYHTQREVEIEGIANYLSVHRSNVRLKDLPNGLEIPIIVEENGRYQLLEERIKKQ